MKKLFASLGFLSFAGAAFSALAAPVYESIAKPWQLNFQPPATPVMEKLENMHDFLLIIITAITVLVLILMTYICIRFSRRRNPVPSKTTHNTKLEIIWTAIPILILVVIAIPSLRIHYFMQRVVDPEMTLKVVGNQWYWHYDYPDQGGFGFDSYIVKDKDLKPGDHRLLTVDNNVVVPVDTKVRVLITGADVIHSWAVPAFGVKRDGVPGRLNESWFQATKIGRYYGQCSELCGVGHGFMPIVVDVVSKEDFNAWVKKQQQAAGIAPNAKAEGQKTSAPVTQPVSAVHKNPDAVIDKEKQSGASPSPAKAAGDTQHPADVTLKANVPAAHSVKGDKPTSANQGTSPETTSDSKAKKQ